VKRDNVNYLVAGGFVAVCAVGLLATLYALAGKTGPVDEYFVRYRNVTGMKFGTAVLYEGYRVGQVERIQPEHAKSGTRYRVVLSVREGWPIRNGSVARVTSSGLISAPFIDIAEGIGKGTLGPGSELPGEARVNIMAALGDAANDFRTLSREHLRPLAEAVQSELTALLRDVRQITDQDVRPLAESLKAQLSGGALLSKIEVLTTELTGVTQRLDHFLTEENASRAAALLGNAATLTGELVGTNRRLQSVLDEKTVATVHSAVENFGALSGGLVETNRRLQGFLDSGNEASFRAALVQTAALTEALARDARAVEKLLEGDEVPGVRSALRGADALISELRETNRRLGSLFRKGNRVRVEAILQNTVLLTAEIRETSRRLARGLLGANEVLGRLVSARNAKNLDRFLANVDAISSELRTAVKGFRLTRRKLDGVLGQVSGLIRRNGDNVSNAVVDIRRTAAVISAHAEGLTYHLEGTARNLHEFTRQIRENPALILSSAPPPDSGYDRGRPR